MELSFTLSEIKFLFQDQISINTFLERMYEKYKNPICIEGDLHTPTWCDNECKKYFFLKQLKNEMESDIPDGREKTFF